jgi:hypothetical protein
MSTCTRIFMQCTGYAGQVLARSSHLQGEAGVLEAAWSRPGPLCGAPRDGCRVRSCCGLCNRCKVLLLAAGARSLLLLLLRPRSLRRRLLPAVLAAATAAYRGHSNAAGAGPRAGAGRPSPPAICARPQHGLNVAPPRAVGASPGRTAYSARAVAVEHGAALLHAAARRCSGFYRGLEPLIQLQFHDPEGNAVV